MQIKATWTFHLFPVRMVSRKRKEWLVAILRTVEQFELEINFLIEFLLQCMQGAKILRHNYRKNPLIYR